MCVAAVTPADRVTTRRWWGDLAERVPDPAPPGTRIVQDACIAAVAPAERRQASGATGTPLAARNGRVNDHRSADADRRQADRGTTGPSTAPASLTTGCSTAAVAAWTGRVEE